MKVWVVFFNGDNVNAVGFTLDEGKAKEKVKKLNKLSKKTFPGLTDPYWCELVEITNDWTDLSFG